MRTVGPRALLVETLIPGTMHIQSFLNVTSTASLSKRTASMEEQAGRLHSDQPLLVH